MGDGLPSTNCDAGIALLFRGVYVPKRATPSLVDRTLGAWLGHPIGPG